MATQFQEPADSLDLLDFPSPSNGRWVDVFGDTCDAEEQEGVEIEDDVHTCPTIAELSEELMWSFSDLGGAPGSARKSSEKRSGTSQSWRRSSSDSRLDLAGRNYFFFDENTLSNEAIPEFEHHKEALFAVPNFQEPGENMEIIEFPESRESEECPCPSPSEAVEQLVVKPARGDRASTPVVNEDEAQFDIKKAHMLKSGLSLQTPLNEQSTKGSHRTPLADITYKMNLETRRHLAFSASPLATTTTTSTRFMR
eukprot:m.28393 g.28393  ORF g.28393 m.28393 type:complete len:254 (-) comp8000_c0_seq1:1134-1895(-)